MTARDDVLNERLGSINDNVSRLAESQQLAEIEKPSEELKALDSPRGTDARQLSKSKSEAKIGSYNDSGNYCDWLYGRFNCESCE